jgi:hypothetical protein
MPATSRPDPTAARPPARRARRSAAILPAAAVVGVLVAAAAIAAVPPIRAARWTAPGADIVAALTRRPVECLARPTTAGAAYEVEVGRAAFRAPLLLGGQAARAGLACDSCHTNGRVNRAFYFPGLSGAPGTADVTSSLLSSHRDDGVDNPRPIPDLGGPKSALKVDQSPESPGLARFIHGLVTEEFDGAEPPPAVLQGLAAYVRALTPAACAAEGTEPIRVDQPIADARRAVGAAIAALDRRDDPTAVLMIEAARSQLALIDERYGAFARDRAGVRVAALDLGAAIDDARAARVGAARTALIAWLARTPGWTASLQRDEGRSFYSADVLRLSVADGGGERTAAH